ncbi:MAG TPA: radical SAM family heme chaperone HemW [Rhizomicrobium sp.]|jgi:oxygen-independent coproporphyrinogen-3 oxidase|nr:radical SAM family heme chaperone HemW [Rhizomicrobium sp.]
MTRFEFGVYIHWPFCAAKCPYCDFNSHVRSHIPETEWLKAIGSELRFAASELIPAQASVTSVFFGGGTPSLMHASTAGAVLDALAANWNVSPDAEITIEANPSSVEAERFCGYRAAGVNRVSLGVQSLDDSALNFLGRLHDSEGARRAVELASRTFDRVSIDLIYARPHQSARAWRAELREALSLGTEHLSLYQLTIEDGTPFATRVRAGALTPLSDDPAAELYEETQDMMARAGIPGYEISNHAKPGRECRHNLLYWRYGNYLGVGPGAHGRIIGGESPLATTTERNPERWLARVAARGSGFDPISPITPAEAAREHLLMNLRLHEGFDRRSYRARWGRDLDGDGLRMLAAAGLIETDDQQIRATASGRLVLNAVITALLGPH